jgi:hypothetical protein
LYERIIPFSELGGTEEETVLADFKVQMKNSEELIAVSVDIETEERNITCPFNAVYK